MANIGSYIKDQIGRTRKFAQAVQDRGSTRTLTAVLRHHPQTSDEELAQVLGVDLTVIPPLRQEAERQLLKERLRQKPQSPEPKQARQRSDETIEGEARTIEEHYGPPMAFTEMSPEDIVRRNYAILAKVSHDKPFHDKVLDGIKETWRIVGPIAFVVFTAWEVYYYLNHFMTANNDNSLTTTILLWGVTLLIELPFMIATYDLSGRRKRAVEARRRGQEPPDKDTPGATTAWGVMAVVNITGQVAFLGLITHVADPAYIATSHIDPTPLYIFIAVRVVGVLLGDAYTAFFLSPAETTISRVLAMQKSQGEGFKQLAESSSERQRIESHAQMELKRNQMAIRREEGDAEFLHQFNQLNLENALRTQERLLRANDVKVQIEGPNEPETGDL